MDIYELAENINSKSEFVEFLSLLKNDLEHNRDSWDNNSLEAFINGLHGHYYDKPESNLSWKDFAHSLLAAKVYE